MKKLGRLLLICAAVFGILCLVVSALPDEWFEEDTVQQDTYQQDDKQQNSAAEGETSTNKTETASNKETSGSASNSSLFDMDIVRTKRDYSDAKSVTILCYMNGSNLETDDSEATTDILEMIDAPYSSNVNIVIQTMGTKKWDRELGIASDHSQRYLVRENGIELIDDSLGQLDCTRSSTLSDFITWGTEKYPADRYILLFWNHGGGPVYGFGYDEFQSYEDAMTIDEIQLAIDTAGVYFDFIGMDCCIMSCLEVCCAMYGYCDYMVLSEDFEPGLGWSYEGWITAIANNPAIDTLELGKIICDDCVKANETSYYGDDCILSVLDESVMRVLFTAWTEFAYANEDTLLNSNYSRSIKRGSGYRVPARCAARAEDDYQLADYNITDIMAVAQNVDSEESKALASAVSSAVVYNRATSGDSFLTGLSVTLPYGDSEFYSSLRTIFTNCGFDEDYIQWLSGFTSANGIGSYYDYGTWDDVWGGWDSYYDDYDWNSWDYYDDDSYWDDDSQGWWDWDYLNYWLEDWWNYDDYDYHYDGYCDDEYWDDYGYWYDDYWDSYWEEEDSWDDWNYWDDWYYYDDGYYYDDDYYYDYPYDLGNWGW